MQNNSQINFEESFLQEICDLPSPSGYEQPVQQYLIKKISPFVDEVKRDVLGNLIGVLNQNSKIKLMLDGHVDEVGLQIRYIDDNGFIFFNALGGVDAHLTPGGRVKILTRSKEILGVIGKKAIHLQDGDDRSKVIEIEKQFIDVGAKTRDEVKNLGIQIGDPIIFDTYYHLLGNHGDVVSRCFDDKVGAFIVAEVLRRLKETNEHHINIYGSFSVQEEVGCRGAQITSQTIKPDFAISFDVDFAMDTPVLKASEYGDTKLGEGPIICRGPGVNSNFFNLIVSTAQEQKIPIQIVSETFSTGTNSDIIQLAHSGVITAVISIPCRYMHSMSEIVNLHDIEQVIRLSVAVAQKLKDTSHFIPN